VEDVAQLGGRETAGEFYGTGERSFFVAQQGDANFGAQRPLGVVADGFDEGSRGSGAQQRAGDGGFGEAGIFEGGLPDAGFFVEQQGGGHTGRGATSERDALSHRDGGDAGDEQVVGGALQVSGDCGLESELHQVESVELADQAQRNAARGARMRGYGDADLARFHDSGVVGDLFDGVGGQVAALEQGEGKVWGEGGVGGAGEVVGCGCD